MYLEEKLCSSILGGFQDSAGKRHEQHNLTSVDPDEEGTSELPKVHSVLDYSVIL